MGHIFISYSHKDNDYVRKLEKALIEKGFDVWIDERINYGTKWPKVIQENLDDCDAFVAVVSENSFASDWVQHEVTRAQRKGKPFFPLLLNGDAWLSIESTQYVDVRGEKLPPDSFYVRLEQVVVRYRQTNQSGKNLPNLPRIKSISQFSDTKKPIQTSEQLDQQEGQGENILPSSEISKPKGWVTVKASPIFRLGLVILLVGGLIAGVVFGFIIPSMLRAQQLPPTYTPGPSPIFTVTLPPTYTPGPFAIFTATLIVISGEPRATHPVGTPSGPLFELLVIPYTPTALYVQINRSPLTSDSLLQYNQAIKTGNWDDAIAALNNIILVEPTASYAYYYIGDAYLRKDDIGNAIQAYNDGIQKDPSFGPMYEGLARARLIADPNANVLPLLDQAIQLDPNFGDAYLYRGMVKIRDNDIPSAINDLGEANTRLPDNPLVFYNLAQARFKVNNYDLALGAAQKANQLDVTLLPDYLLLGQIYTQAGNNNEAIKALQVYIKYETEDVEANDLLGRLLYSVGKYDQAIQMMNRVLTLDSTRHEAYAYRFLSNVELGNGAEADKDLDIVINFYPDLFDSNLALVRTHILNKRYDSAEQALGKTISLAKTNEQKARAYYWGGIVYEKRNQPEQAMIYWQKIINLPKDDVTSAIYVYALQHIGSIITPTLKP